METAMILELLKLIPGLAATGVTLYEAISQHQVSGDTEKVAALLPIAANVFGSLQQVGNVLAQAQDEKWLDNDERWAPVFEAADVALKAAEDRL